MDAEQPTHPHPQGQLKPIPRHSMLDLMEPTLGPVRAARTRKEKLQEYIDSCLTFDGFDFSFETAVGIVCRILEDYNVDPAREEGQGFLAAFVDKAFDELYGDFSLYEECLECGEEYQHEHTLAYVNRVRTGSGLCPNCRADEED